MDKWDIVSSRPKGNPVAGISLFAILMLALLAADHFFGVPPEVVKTAIAASAISAVAVAI